MGLSPLVAALLMIAPIASADEAADIVGAAKKSGIGKSCVIEANDRFCSSERACQTFCACACTFDVDNWGKVDHDTKCPGAPRSGPGMLAVDSPDLVTLPNLGPYIVGARGKRATQAVADGLRRLADYLASDPDHERQRYGYRVLVKSCYRPAVGDPNVGDGDTEKECHLIMAATHMLEKPLSDSEKAKWRANLNPPKKGLTWPGATPHSAGAACDLVLIDAQGDESFDWRAGVDAADVPHSSIDQRVASELLDKAVTNSTVGGRRLNYEAWHYEWGGPSSCRCAHPDCARNHWPPTGAPHC